MELNDTTEGTGPMDLELTESAEGVQYRKMYTLWILADEHLIQISQPVVFFYLITLDTLD